MKKKCNGCGLDFPIERFLRTIKNIEQAAFYLRQAAAIENQPA